MNRLYLYSEHIKGLQFYGKLFGTQSFVNAAIVDSLTVRTAEALRTTCGAVNMLREHEQWRSCIGASVLPRGACSAVMSSPRSQRIDDSYLQLWCGTSFCLFLSSRLDKVSLPPRNEIRAFHTSTNCCTIFVLRFSLSNVCLWCISIYFQLLSLLQAFHDVCNRSQLQLLLDAAVTDEDAHNSRGSVAQHKENGFGSELTVAWTILRREWIVDSHEKPLHCALTLAVPHSCLWIYLSRWNVYCFVAAPHMDSFYQCLYPQGLLSAYFLF